MIEIKEPVKVDIEFMECDTCRAKAGSPIICKGCLFNRDVIQRLGEELTKLSGNKQKRDE